MTKLELQLIALEGEKNKLEKNLFDINTQIVNLRNEILKNKYGRLKKTNQPTLYGTSPEATPMLVGTTQSLAPYCKAVCFNF